MSDIYNNNNSYSVAAEKLDKSTVERIKKLTMDKVHASENAKATPVRRPVRIAIAAAALVAIVPTTVFATTQIFLKDYKMGNNSYTVASGLEVADLSVNGLKESPEAKAFAEWKSYITQWNDDNPGFFDDKEDGDRWYEVPDNYYGFYGAVTKEHGKKLEEIAAKYGLNLHTSRCSYNDPDEAGELLGIDGSLYPGDYSGYMYEDGSFKAECIWDYNYWIFVQAKDTFSDIYANFDTDYEEKIVTASDGTQVLIAKSKNSGNTICFTECESYTLSASFYEMPEDRIEACVKSIRYADLEKALANNGADIKASVTAKQDREANCVYDQASDDAYESKMFEQGCLVLGRYDLPENPDGFEKRSEYFRLEPFGQTVSYSNTVTYWSKDAANDHTPAFISLNYSKTGKTSESPSYEEVENGYFAKHGASSDFLSGKTAYDDRINLWKEKDQSKLPAEITEIEINGCTGVIKTVNDPGSSKASFEIVWYDASNDLCFSFYYEADNCKITADQAIELASRIAAVK